MDLGSASSSKVVQPSCETDLGLGGVAGIPGYSETTQTDGS